MWVRCPKCHRGYDDSKQWTICPHSPLGCAVDDLCPKCDTLRSVHGPCRHQQEVVRHPPMNEQEKLRRDWRRAVRHMNSLIERDAPAILKAQWIVTVLIPKLAALSGCIPQLGNELSRILTRHLSMAAGVCCLCNKAPTLRESEYCPKCLAEIDQFAAEFGLGDGGEEQDDA